MNLKNIFKSDGDERAVSPVIGVILMVAITVILAAVIGAFVIGIGDDQSTVPQASWDISQSTEEIDGDDYTTMTVTHSSGSSISESNIDVTVEGSPGYDVDDDAESDEIVWSGQDDISAGNEVRVVGKYTGTAGDFSSGEDFSGSDYNELEEDDTLRIVWESDDGSDSSVLQSQDVN